MCVGPSYFYRTEGPRGGQVVEFYPKSLKMYRPKYCKIFSVTVARHISHTFLL